MDGERERARYFMTLYRLCVCDESDYVCKTLVVKRECVVQ